MDINITPEDVETLVKTQLIKCGIGKAIADGVTKALSGYDNPIDAQIKKYMGEVTEKIIREKYAEHITKLVADALSKKLTKELQETIVDAAMDKVIRKLSESY